MGITTIDVGSETYTFVHQWDICEPDCEMEECDIAASFEKGHCHVVQLLLRKTMGSVIVRERRI